MVVEELDLHWISHLKDWRINEKHYGAFEGLNKHHEDKEIADRLQMIRGSYDIPPPLLRLDDPRHPIHQPKYQSIPPELLPSTESMKCMEYRVEQFYKEQLLPNLELD